MRVVRSFARESPCLFVCSTPIGNLNDVSYRLIETLRSADVIAAEDTRQTRKLLTHFAVQAERLVSYHHHNRHKRHTDFVRWWEEGLRIAVVSDAGTPGVSDPGADAVQLAIATGVPVIPVPGPSAVLSALVASGLPIQPFTFVGFLPRSRKEAEVQLEAYRRVPGVLVFYESPHRVLSTLRWFTEWFPTRQVVLGKELTKLHETFFYADTAEAMLAELADEHLRGEFVLILGPHTEAETISDDGEQTMTDAVRMVLSLMEAGTSHRAAVQHVTQVLGVRRKDLYQRTLTGTDPEPNEAGMDP